MQSFQEIGRSRFAEIERKRREAGLNRSEVCRKAAINRETWRRLTKGQNTTIETLDKLTAAVETLAQERQGFNA